MFSSNRYCFTKITSRAITDFLSHKRIALGVKVLVPGCQGGSPAVIAFLSTWLPTGNVLAGSSSFSTSFTLSCHALPEWLFLFDLLLFLCVYFLLTAGLCFCISLLWRMQTDGAGALLKEAKQAWQEAFRRCLEWPDHTMGSPWMVLGKQI